MTVTFGLRVAFVPFIAVVLCGLLVPVPADASRMRENCSATGSRQRTVANLIIAITV